MPVEARGGHRVLVLDGEQRSALAVVRSLGAAGYRVDVAGETPRALTAASRFRERFVAVPDPLADPEAYRSAVAAEVGREDYSVVLPVTEPSALALLDDPTLASRIPMPSRAIFDEVNDKVRLLERAASLGVDVPRFVTLRGPGDPAGREWSTFPAVVKPGRSVVGTGERRRKTAVRFVADAGALASALEELSPDAFPVMVQERLEGAGMGVFLLMDRGERVAAFAHRRIREKPPQGGVSVYRESIRAPEALVSQAERLLGSFEWTGVAMVEFKHDEATNRYGLMEINGRFWGSLQLAIDAGADFPRLLVDRFLQLSREVCDEYRVGIRSRWEWGDVDHLLIRMRRGGARGGLATWFRPWWPGDRLEVFRFGDPGPFVAETRSWFRSAFGKAP